jgi:autotransporter-associated beta strand protein
LHDSRQIDVVANNLTIGGSISGSGFGLTKVGDGVLMLNGVNTYDGDTIVSAGTFGGSGTLAGAATFDAGSKAVFTVTPGGPIGNNSTVMKITGVMTYNANEVHLNLPANLPGGTYALAYSDATPVANGAFPTPVVDSGSYSTVSRPTPSSAARRDPRHPPAPGPAAQLRPQVFPHLFGGGQHAQRSHARQTSGNQDKSL